MNPIFNVPFLPEPSYIDFLTSIENHLDSVQFSLLDARRLDSRIQLESLQMHEQLETGLIHLQSPKKYVLLNSRFYSPALLTEQENIAAVISSLDRFADKGLLDGIIYCDHYLLQRLSDEAPGLVASIEAVPSVNCMLDSYAKVETRLSYISDTHFKLPTKILLDRSLNRDLDSLAQVARKIRQKLPGVGIEVLANEGCLPSCPFKLSHDAYIALANIEGRDCTFQLNQNLGCVRVLGEEPHRILQSPFIRPEDVELYLYHVDTIKLCGRTLGGRFLKRLLNAYIDRKYEGNLLDLLDALHWLSGRLYVDNPSLSFDFANMLSMCDGQCTSCGFCEEMFHSITHPLPLTIPDNREPVD
jgi:collagenase-like PrtC family protease